jgi:adenylate kinase family enzyme
MKPIFDSMKSYIDYKINNELYPSNEDTNNNKNDFCVLPDESLCLLLIKKIEEDFPLLSENKTKKIMMEKQKNIKDMEKQIELIKKRKLEAKKPNPKDDLQIEKLEKDIKNIKLKSVTGFILVDYPNNINQCLLLENYLTGYIEEKRRQKSKKDILISKTNFIIDYKYQIKEKKMDKKSGLNFIVNISTKESIINERFESAKYDPVDKVLYTGQNIQIEDKIIKERLVNKIPNLPKELF